MIGLITYWGGTNAQHESGRSGEGSFTLSVHEESRER